MDYKVTTRNNNIVVDVNADKLALTVKPNEYSVSLSRTGGQGSKGDTISNAYIDENNDLIIETLASDGTVTQLNAGTFSFDEAYSLNALNDVTLADLQSGDIVIYDSETSQFKNHQLTTSKVLDIDNTNVSDGALLVYNGNNSKYTATTTLENPNTIIRGGEF